MAGITPVWRPAIAGSPAGAGDVNQFLTGHDSTISYGGTLTSSAADGGVLYSDTYTQWLAQQILLGAGQTTIGFLRLQVATVGGSPVLPLVDNLSVSLYADAFGLPTGDPLATVSVTGVYMYKQPYWATIPLAAAALTPGGAYQVVTAMSGDSSHFYAWQHAAGASGASTSPDGVSWTAQGFDLMFEVFDQAGGGDSLPLSIDEDDGLRVTSFGYSDTRQLVSLSTYTTSSGGTVAYDAVLTYTHGVITGVN